jgi:Xaa-Pro dipeptidase
MVITIEPPIHIHKEGIGVRIIDNVLVTETGAEILSGFTRDLISL